MKEHVIPGAIAAVVASSIAGGIAYYAPAKVEQVQHAIMTSKHAWPDLTDGQKADLAARLAAFKGTKILILSADAASTDLAQDIDDAAEVAGIDSALDRPMLPLGYGIGVQAEAGDDKGDALAAAISAVTGFKAEVTSAKTTSSGYPLWIVIGKHR
jgi:hypothetical protein